MATVMMMMVVVVMTTAWLTSVEPSVEAVNSSFELLDGISDTFDTLNICFEIVDLFNDAMYSVQLYVGVGHNIVGSVTACLNRVAYGILKLGPHISIVAAW